MTGSRRPQSLFGVIVDAIAGAERTDHRNLEDWTELIAKGRKPPLPRASAEIVVNTSAYDEAEVKKTIGLLNREGRKVDRLLRGRMVDCGGDSLRVSLKIDLSLQAEAEKALAKSLQQAPSNGNTSCAFSGATS